MNHQPFETWILDESELSQVQKHDLLEHLEICPKCASLEKNWKSARQEIRSMPAVNAPAGFHTRWHASLADRRRAHELQQTRTLLIILVSSAIAILITLGIFLLPHTSMVSLLVSMLTGFMQVVNSISEIWTFITSMLRFAPASFLISVGVIVSLCTSLITIIWVFSFYRITMKGTSVVHEK
jgi:hypothetical protein